MAGKKNGPASASTWTDEGVPYSAVDAITIANLSTDLFDAKRQELRVNSRPYQHVGQNGSGQWTYRYDR